MEQPATDTHSIDDLVGLLRSDPAATALLFDLDGVLAPIVDDPAAASALDGVAATLDELALRYGRVAVVSGRPRSFLRTQVGASVDLSGQYGLETRIGGRDAEHPDAPSWRAAVADAAASGEERLAPGVVVESKGLSLTVHFRNAEEHESAVREWAREAAAATGLDLRSAKQAVELHPAVDVDKGTSVAEFSQGCATVVYFGDDIGDLPAFAALDRLADRAVRTSKVAVASPEMPAELASMADHVLDGPDEVLAVLHALR